MDHLRVGQFAENSVAQYLTAKGYEILDRNWRRKWGELDIVARRDNIIVFIEVKAGTSDLAGFDPSLHANREKIQKVVRTARTWLLNKKYPTGQEWQVDLITILLRASQKTLHVTHFKNIDI